MRNLFIIAMLLVGAFMAGWFKINRDGDSTTIEINRNEIRSDARNAINRGREYLDRRDQQYADQQYAEQQYADQQYAEQPVADANGQYWPREQVAAQTDPWGRPYEAQQQPQAPNYRDPNYYPRDEGQPGRPSTQPNPYPQPY